MDAKELRIGNWVDYFGKTRVVIKIEKKPSEWYVGAYNNVNGLLDTYNVIDAFKPIPLTEEWLLKFGFEGSSSDYTKNKLSITLEGADVYHKKGRVYYNNWAIKEEQPNHVHQLQNLYFVLTGEELEIN